MQRSQKSHFFSCKTNQHQASPRRFVGWQIGETACKFQHCRGARGVVVGSVVNFFSPRRSRTVCTQANVIVMCSHDDGFVRQFTLAGDDGDKVGRVNFCFGENDTCVDGPTFERLRNWLESRINPFFHLFDCCQFFPSWAVHRRNRQQVIQRCAFDLIKGERDRPKLI